MLSKTIRSSELLVAAETFEGARLFGDMESTVSFTVVLSEREGKRTRAQLQ